MTEAIESPAPLGLPGRWHPAAKRPGRALPVPGSRPGVLAGRLRGGPLGGASMLLASSLSVQLGAALATTIFAVASPAGVAGLSLTIAAVLLLALRRPRPAGWSRERWRDVTLFGLACGANSVLFYLALDRLPLGTVVTIEFLGPLTLALLTARRRRHRLAVAFALLGIVLVSGASPSTDLLGIGLALAAACGFGLYLLASRRAGAHPGGDESLAVAMGVAALACLPLSVGAAGRIDGLGTLAALVIVAAFGRALPYGLEMLALRRLRPGTVGVLLSIEPAIAAVVGIVALGESLAAPQALGIVLVVSAGAIVLHDAVE